MTVGFAGMNPEFASALQRALEDAYQATGEKLDVLSGYRSKQRQAELYAHDRSGMVGSPEGSRHPMGTAGDLGSGGRIARAVTPGGALEWLHQHGADYNIHFPLMTGRTPRPEPWHVEAGWSRGGAPPTPGQFSTGLSSYTKPGQYAEVPPEAQPTPQPSVDPALVRAALLQSAPRPPGVPGSLSDVFNQITPGTAVAQTTLPDQPMVGAPIPLARRLT